MRSWRPRAELTTAIDERLDRYAFEDLEKGMSAVISKTVTEAELLVPWRS